MVYDELTKVLDDLVVVDGKLKGLKKTLPYYIMPNGKMKSWSAYCSCKNSENKWTEKWNEESADFIGVFEPNPDYQEAPGKIRYALKKIRDEEYMYMQNSMRWTEKIQEERFMRYVGDPEIVWDYLGERPFEPWIMINICPDWKGPISKQMIEDLERLFNMYMKIDGFYSRWMYCLEGGSDGDMLHLHAVCKMGNEPLKSQTAAHSHLSHHNHFQQLKKYSKKIKGLQGKIKGPGIQKVFCMNEEILKDKRLYLREKNKPEGHKNKTIVVENSNFNGHNRFVVGKFTVK